MQSSDACGKATYSSKPEADRVMARIRRKPNQREDRPCRSYRCPTCKGWHLTSNHSKKPIRP